ncbi:MAG: hypothetical protein D6743_16595, partial [Calditrichaeota bacterium]
LSQDEEGKKRFVQEAKAASALNHPNIATIYEIDEADGQLFIAMEYIEGQSLRAILDANLPKVLNLREGLDYATQIAEGLQAAHKKGIIHRDIKPANLMVTDEKQVKILDFGLAKLVGITDLTASGATLGTVAYMSPEQAQGVAADGRADIWALGVVLYEMITGRSPFKGKSDPVVLYSVVNEAHQPLTALRQDVPADLGQIVDRAMAKDPDQRYQSIEEMVTDLRAVSNFERAPRRPKARLIARRPSRTVLAGLTVLLFVLLLGTFALFRISEKQDGSALRQHRIAVLPLVNISEDPADEYFADGMTEELIATLSKISELQVIARTSVMRYKHASKSIAEIGRELKVATVIEGSVRHAANRIRISVQLIDVQNEAPLWSHDYDRKLEDVFAIQSLVARQVARAFEIQLRQQEERRLAQKSTENLEAYNLYLKGRYFWNKRDQTGLKKGVEYFQRAIELDPNYALAYAGLADSYTVGWRSNELSPRQRFLKVREAAMKALEIDDTLAEAHVALASYVDLYNWDWQRAEQEYRRAIELNPNYAIAHHWYGNFLMRMGRSREGLRHSRIAQELDPLSLIINASWGHRLYYARRYDQAIAQCKKALELDGDFVFALHYLGGVYEKKGLCDQAIEVLEKAMTLSQENPPNIAALSRTYATCGREDEARSLLHSLIVRSGQSYVSPYHIAAIYEGLGEKDRALQWLEKAYNDRDPVMAQLKVDPRLDGLRQSPRFAVLLKKMGLER